MCVCVCVCVHVRACVCFAWYNGGVSYGICTYDPEGEGVKYNSRTVL